MDAHLAGFFIVGQDLNATTASPDLIVFEGLGRVVLVKRGKRLDKHIFKKFHF